MSVYEGKEDYIFASFVPGDISRVQSMIFQIQEDGFRLWYAEDLKEHDNARDEELAERIESCRVFLAFITSDYLASADGRDELNYARDLQKQCVLVYLDDSQLPKGMQMRLSRLQALYLAHYEKPQDFYRQLYQADGFGQCRQQERPAISREKVANDKKKNIWKRVCAVAGVAAAAVIVVFGIQKGLSLREEELAEEQNRMVTVIFYPNENLNMDQYSRRTEELKKEFEILCGEDVVFESEDKDIKVTFPKSIFGDSETWEEQMTQILEDYVIMPILVELGNDKEDLSESEWVYVTDVESVEVKTGTFPDATESELEEYGIEGEEVSYIEVTIDEETAQKLDEKIADWGSEPVFGNPIISSGFWGVRRALTAISDDRRTICFAFGAMNSCENLSEMIAYKIENFDYTDEEMQDTDTFYEPFTYAYDIPVNTWENVKQENANGENQCNEDELSDTAVMMQFSESSIEIGEGEREDEIAALKARLDTLEEPYAIGWSNDGDGSSLIVKMEKDHLGEDVMNLLECNSGFSLGTFLYDVGYVWAENFSLVDCNDGTWQIEISFSEDDDRYEKLREASAALAADGGGTIWLSLSSWGGTRLASAEVNEEITDGKLVLDQLTILCAESITEDELWAVNLMETVLSQEMDYFSLGKWQIGSVQAGTLGQEELGVLPDESVLNLVREIVDEVDSEIEVEEDSFGDITITITISDEEDASLEISKIKDIYQKCDFDSGIASFVGFNLMGEDGSEYASVYFHADKSDTHTMQLSRDFWASDHPEYEASLTQIVNADEFFVSRMEAEEVDSETEEE